MCNFLLNTSNDKILLTVGKLLKESTSFWFSPANSGHGFFSVQSLSASNCRFSDLEKIDIFT